MSVLSATCSRVACTFRHPLEILLQLDAAGFSGLVVGGFYTFRD